MTAYYGSKKIKKVYLGTQNTNCLTYIPQDINLELDPLNVTVVGSPTVSSGVVSGFSGANYLKLPKIFNPSSNSWEIVIKARTPSAFSKRNWITGGGNAAGKDSDFVSMGLENNGKPLIYITSNGTSWDIANGVAGSNTLTVNTDYLFRCQFTGTKYIYSTSADNGSTWVTQITVNSTTKIFVPTTAQAIGTSCYIANAPEFWSGSIDLSQSYIKINGSIWWKGGTGKLTLKAGSKVYVPNGYTSYKYYKATYGSWTRPNLTSNTSNTSFTLVDPKLSGGTLSGTTMTWGSSAVTRFTDVWKSFDSDTSSYFTINNGSLTFTVFDIIFSDYMKVSGVTITGNVVNSQASALSGSQIYALKDDGSYALLSTKTDSNVNTHTFTATRTRRLRICARPGADGNGYPSRLTNITITAQKQTGGTESTSSDYDYKVGSGSMVFDEVVLSKDISIATGLTTDTHERTLAVNVTNMNYNTLYTTESGTGYTGTGTVMYYNTTENLVQRYSSGVLQSYRLSLPIARVKADGSVTYGSISQVFNGFGYIGMHKFRTKGIKFLAGNGINPDGSYNSVEIETTDVLLKEANNVNEYNWFELITKDAWYNNTEYYIQNTTPTVTTNAYWYNPNENKMYRWNGSEWQQRLGVICGKSISANKKVSSFTINPVQPEKTGREISRIYKGSTLVYGYGVNEVLFESSTAGTATVNIEYDGYYELTVIGGGSGGAFEYSAKYADGAAAGGSGAGLIGVAYLSAGSYSITVGAGGAGKWDNNASETVTASAGSASKFGSIVTAGGGSAPKAVYNGGTQTAGAGGTLSYTSSAFKSVSLAKNGNAGTTNNNASTSSTYAGGSSVISGKTYGAGGKAQYGGAYAGTAGYVKVVAV